MPDSIIRAPHPDEQETVEIAREWVDDSRLSFEALGLLLVLHAGMPSVGDLIEDANRRPGTSADNNTALLELVGAGYVRFARLGS